MNAPCSDRSRRTLHKCQPCLCGGAKRLSSCSQCSSLEVGSSPGAYQVPDDVPGVAWNSPWVFRGAVFVGFFVGAYVVLAICATTIVSGRPPKKLSFGLLAYEQAELEKTVDELSEGGTALQAVEAEVRCS
jgi:hypothetical protein